jgi:hypothetical protein
LGLRYDWQSNLDRQTNLAPRIALAYAPGDQKTVFRAGAGMFYEYLPVPALWRNSLFDAARQEELVITNPNFPNPFAPRIKGLPPSIFRLDPNLKAPYLIESSVGIERQLWRNAQIALEAYVIRGVHQFRTLDVNAPSPQTGMRPISSLLNIYQLGSGALMQGKGLNLSFRGGIGKRAYFVAQYTLSRTINDADSIFSLPASNYDLPAERGRAVFDRRHRFSLTGMINLPGSMRIGTLLALATGAPFDITTGFDGNHDTMANDRLLGGTRNQGQGTGIVQMDIRFTKLFKVPRVLNREGSAKNFEINVDVFNALNHPNFTNFIGVRNSALFGNPSVALPGRTIQFSLRYRF